MLARLEILTVDQRIILKCVNRQVVNMLTVGHIALAQSRKLFIHVNIYYSLKAVNFLTN
jgi:hypothetical protein